MTDLQKEPKVSIVCAWYNRADYIRDTVDGLLNQDFDDYEIIIANDGSPDPRVKELLDSYDDPKLTVIHKDNEGFTKTIKMLVEMARAPYVAIQGAGEVSLSERIAKQYEFLSRSPDYALIGCSSVNILKKPGQPDVFLKESRVITGDVFFDAKRKKLPFTHGALMFRKSAYMEVGGYREIFKYAQDYDLFLRISLKYKCFNLDEVLYQRNIFTDGVSTAPMKSFEQAMFVKFANKSFFMQKKHGKDIINEYGVVAFALHKPDMQDHKSIFRLITKLLYSSNFNEAELIVSFQGRAIASFYSVFVSLIMNSPRAHNIFKALINKLYKDSVYMTSND